MPNKNRAFFDCQYGVSGDMILGCVLDCGVPVDELRVALQSLSLDGWTIDPKPVQRCGVGATFANVHAHEHHHHRGMPEIRNIITRAAILPQLVKDYALSAFTYLAEAEAAVHQTTIDEVHFHEVGAVDAIIDIVGAMWGLDSLGILSAEVATSPIAVGGGTVRAAHGVMPVPAPATLRLLSGVVSKSGPVEKEMATPTGVAILKALCHGDTSRMGSGMPAAFSPAKVGYGAGSREIPGHTNYLRLMVEDSAATALPYETQERVMLECEIDDMTPELLAAAAETLMDNGAADVHIVSCMMKKSRPGMRLCVLTDNDKLERMTEIMLKETTTFGVRLSRVERHVLRREFRNVQTPYGIVKIKLGYWGNDLLKATPEYSDCKAIATVAGVSVSHVYASVLQNFNSETVS